MQDYLRTLCTEVTGPSDILDALSQKIVVFYRSYLVFSHTSFKTVPRHLLTAPSDTIASVGDFHLSFAYPTTAEVPKVTPSSKQRWNEVMMMMDNTLIHCRAAEW